MSLEALRPRTTVESAMEMARPAGLCGDTTNPSILQEKVKNCYSFLQFLLNKEVIAELKRSSSRYTCSPHRL